MTTDTANASAASKVSLGDSVIGRAFASDEDVGSAAAIHVKLSSIYIDKESNSRDVNSDKYGADSIANLAAQIRTTNGLLHPIVIAPLDSSNEETEFKDFILVAGYRRSLALQKLAHDDGNPAWVNRIPARVTEISDHATFAIVQAIENVGRADLSALEICDMISNILTESRGKLSQTQLAQLIGLSQGAVSRYLSLKKLPDEIKKMLASGAIGFTNAAMLCSGEYNIEDANLIRLAKIGSKFTTAAFKELLDSRYKKQSGDAKPDKKNPAGKYVKPTVIEKIYIPFLKEKIASLAEKELKPQYTEADILAARFDMIQAFQGVKSAFSEEVEPYRQKIQEVIDAEKRTEKQKKGYVKFIATLVKRVRDLMKLPPVEGARPFPTIASALVKIGGELASMKQADIDKLDIKIDIANSLKDILDTVKDEYLKQDRELIKKREAAKAKKLQEEKEAKASKKEAGEDATAKTKAAKGEKSSDKSAKKKE